MMDDFQTEKSFLKELTTRFLGDESGATVIEYGLIASLIFLSIVASVNNFANTTSDLYEEIEGTLDDAIN